MSLEQEIKDFLNSQYNTKNIRADYTTNSKSYYNYLEKVTGILVFMSKKIDEYDGILTSELQKIKTTLDGYLEKWDENLENFDESVLILLQEWMDDGTFEHIINHEIFKNKLDTSIFEQFELSVNQQLQHIAIHASKFGAVGDGEVNDTEALMEANAYCVDRGFRLIGTGTYMVDDDWDLLDGSIIDFTGFYIKRMPTSANSYNVINIDGKQDIHLYNPNIIGDRDEHITRPNPNNDDGYDGEWGHGISIRRSKNIHIYNAKVYKCWGDGIYIGSTANFDANESVWLHGTTYVKDCRRQGISGIGGKGIYVDRIVAEDIHGTRPMFAVDLEPNTSDDHIEDVNIESIIAIRCHGAIGLYTRGGKLSGRIGSVSAIDCFGRSIAMGYTEVGDETNAHQIPSYINADNTFRIDSLYVNRANQSVLSMSRMLANVFPHVSIGSVTIGEMVYDPAIIEDKSLQWNVVAFVADRQYDQKQYGNVHIGPITVHKIVGETSIPLFAGINRLLSGDNYCVQQNVKIDDYKLIDIESGTLSDPFTAFSVSKNCSFNPDVPVNIINATNPRLRNGINVATVPNVSVRELVNSATILCLASSLTFSFTSLISQSYRIYVNGSVQPEGVTALPPIFNLHNRIVTVNRDEKKNTLSIHYSDVDELYHSHDRPTNPRVGTIVFDPYTDKLILYNGTVWKDAMGNIL